jgi:hypothetical protein
MEFVWFVCFVSQYHDLPQCSTLSALAMWGESVTVRNTNEQTGGGGGGTRVLVECQQLFQNAAAAAAAMFSDVGE